ncbi:hypothetical protein Pmani_030691 [Petrolisthes manimaculis]|uniref:Uncharacterized protein n=1 Tax=Petrolisthes manimaculis TaxID=1843537 RepID=A0AAE1NXF0_9EUCA|nr:hypothetical protein Pmani_030691 [Petrolisthes manimaculis]
MHVVAPSLYWVVEDVIDRNTAVSFGSNFVTPASLRRVSQVKSGRNFCPPDARLSTSPDSSLPRTTRPTTPPPFK